MERKVIVFGASGKTGLQICRQLEEKKVEHKAFIRKPSITSFPLGESNVISGDVMIASDVNEAFKICDFSDVVITLGSKALKGISIRSEGTKNIILAMNQNKSNAKLHVVSALGVRESWSQLNWFGKLISKLLLGSVMKDHYSQESAVVNGPYKYHLVRPVGLTDKSFNGKIYNNNEGYMPSNQISRKAVAVYLVDSMLKGKEGASSICEFLKLGKNKS